MSNPIELYKTFWKNIRSVVKEHNIKGFQVEFSGSGDEGQIDEVMVITGGRRTKTSAKKKGQKDEFGHAEIPPHPWNHSGESVLDIEEAEKIIVSGILSEKETWVDGQGWVKDKSVKDLPLLEVVKQMTYDLMEHWWSEWEVNEGSRGTLYLYKKEAEYEYIKYFEDYDELQRGVYYYSNRLTVNDFEDWCYEDRGYRGIWVDEELEPLDNDEDDEE